MLISNLIKENMNGMDVSVLMGANVANEGALLRVPPRRAHAHAARPPPRAPAAAACRLPPPTHVR